MTTESKSAPAEAPSRPMSPEEVEGVRFATEALTREPYRPRSVRVWRLLAILALLASLAFAGWALAEHARPVLIACAAFFLFALGALAGTWLGYAEGFRDGVREGLD